MANDDIFFPELGYSERDSLVERALSRQLMPRIARAWGNPHSLPGFLPKLPAVERQSGRFNTRGRGAKIAAGFSRSPGWTVDRSSGLRTRPRRTFVQYRIVRASAGATYQHLNYLEREGVQRDGQPGRLFTTFSDTVDRKAFLARTKNDPHQFRLILSPEDTAEYPDLKSFARDVIARVETDLDTNLDWVAAEHYDTGRPHIHVVVRGIAEHGRTLHIAGDYLTFGIAQRGSEVVTRDLGPLMQLPDSPEIDRAVDAERFTALDGVIMDRLDNGLVDLRALEHATDLNRSLQQDLISRMRWLERMRLARQEEPLQWRVAPRAAEVLREMGTRAARGDAVRRALENADLKRLPQYFVLGGQLEEGITGAVLAFDHPPDRTDRRFIVLDGVDGHTHYVDIGRADLQLFEGSIVRVSPRQVGPRKLDRAILQVASANGGRYDPELHLRSNPMLSAEHVDTHVRRLDDIRRAVGQPDRQLDGSWVIGPDYLDHVREHDRILTALLPVEIQTLSALPLSQQIGSRGATWLDRQLLGEVEQVHAPYGFGREVQEALFRRQQQLIEQGLLRLDGDAIVYHSSLLDRLAAREARDYGRKLEGEFRKPYAPASLNERIDGVLRRTVELASGRFALIEKSREFTLVPWKPSMGHYLGKSISGIPIDGDLQWSVGRGRGLSI